MSNQASPFGDSCLGALLGVALIIIAIAGARYLWAITP